jgi:hypothetical protein
MGVLVSIRLIHVGVVVCECAGSAVSVFQSVTSSGGCHISSSESSCCTRAVRQGSASSSLLSPSLSTATTATPPTGATYSVPPHALAIASEALEDS